MSVQHVTISKSAFEQIFFSDHLKNIRSVFQEGITFRFNLSEAELDAELASTDSVIGQIYQSYQGLSLPSTNNNILVELQSCSQPDEETQKSILILGEEQGLKDRFKNQFGIRWFSESEINNDLFQFEIERVLTSNEEIADKGWDSMLSSLKLESYNSFFINDRNLFSNEYNAASFRGDRDYKNLGVENIINALDSMLPAHLAIPFHVLISTEQKGEDQKLLNALDNLNQRVKALRSYSIVLEVMLYHSSTRYFSYTHNRRILLNHHWGRVEHGFDLFRYMSRQNSEERDDTFELKNCFLKTTSFSQFSKTKHRFKDIIAEAERKIGMNGQNAREYRLFRDGMPVDSIVNRLFK